MSKRLQTSISSFSSFPARLEGLLVSKKEGQRKKQIFFVAGKGKKL